MQILHSSISLTEIDVTKSTVEKCFTRMELELETELLVVDISISPQVEKSVVEVGQCLFEIAHQEIRHALLKIRYSQILIQLDGALIIVDLYGCELIPWRVRSEILTAFWCSPSVACITPQLKRIFDVSAISSNARSEASNSLLS